MKNKIIIKKKIRHQTGKKNYQRDYREKERKEEITPDLSKGKNKNAKKK